MMLESAFRLLSGEAVVEGAAGVVASRHKMSLGQDVRGESLRFLMPPALEELVRSMAPGIVKGRLVQNSRANSLVYHPIELGEGDGATKFSHPAPLREDGYERDFAVVRLAQGDALPAQRTVSDFKAEVAALIQGAELPDVNFWLMSVGNAEHAYYSSSSSDLVWKLPIIPLRDDGGRLPANTAALASKKVAVIGCGSLGSKVAVSLARSGLGAFLLVDDDLMLPENLVRHDLDYEDVGHHKTDVVARRIQLVGNAEIGIRRHLIGGQEANDSIETLIEGIAACDLIIDCTSNPQAFNYLCAAAAAGAKPMIAGEILAGGIGGRMFRSRPGLDPAPAEARAALDNFYNERGREAGKAPVRYGLEGNDNLRPMIATDADVTIVAGHVTRYAIDLLCNEASVYPVSAYVFAFQEGWFLEYPFETWPVDLGRAKPDTPKEPLDPAAAAEEAGTIQDIIQKFIQDAASRE
jgi:hypothetical protein